MSRRCFPLLFPFITACFVWMTGCATAHPTLQSAKTLEPEEVQITTSASVPLSTVVLDEMISLGRQTASKLEESFSEDNKISENEARDAATSALSTTLFFPAPSYEGMVKVGVAQHWDIGARISDTAVKCEVKHQFIDTENGLDGSLMLGYSYGFGLPAWSIAKTIYDIFNWVDVIDYKRHAVDAAFLLGKEWNDIFSLYGGLRYIFSYVILKQDYSQVYELLGTDEIPKTSEDNFMNQIGAVVGFMVGYKWVFFNLELTALYSIFEPTVLGRNQDLSHATILPSLGLTFKF